MVHIKRASNNYDDCTVLVRFYENQDPDNTDPKKQVVSDILFSDDRENIGITAEFPRGLYEGVLSYKYIFKDDDIICIENTLPNDVGVLTSVNTIMENFIDKLIDAL